LAVLDDWNFSDATNRVYLGLAPFGLDDGTWRDPSGENGPESCWADDNDTETETDLEEMLDELQTDFHTSP
jgi:hypothetical protein